MIRTKLYHGRSSIDIIHITKLKQNIIKMYVKNLEDRLKKKFNADN